MLPIPRPSSVYRRPTEHVISPTLQGVKEPGLFHVKHPGFPLDLTSRPCLDKELSKGSSTDVGAGAHLPTDPTRWAPFCTFLPPLPIWSYQCYLPGLLLPLGFFLLSFLFELPLCCHLPSQGPQDPTLGPPLTRPLIITRKLLSLKSAGRKLPLPLGVSISVP